MANRPHRVTRPDQRRVDELDLGRAHRRRGTEVEIAFDRVELEPEGTEPVVERGRDVRRAEQRADAGGAAQRRVDRRDQRRGVARDGRPSGAFELRTRERFDQLGRERRRVGRGSPGAAPDDAHNAAHSDVNLGAGADFARAPRARSGRRGGRLPLRRPRGRGSRPSPAPAARFPTAARARGRRRRARRRCLAPGSRTPCRQLSASGSSMATLRRTCGTRVITAASSESGRTRRAITSSRTIPVSVPSPVPRGAC